MKLYDGHLGAQVSRGLNARAAPVRGMHHRALPLLSRYSYIRLMIRKS